MLTSAVVSPNNLEKQVDAKPQAKVEPMPCKMPPVGSDTVFPRADNIFESGDPNYSLVTSKTLEWFDFICTILKTNTNS